MIEKHYSAIAIANAFLDIANQNKVGVSPMKLQKLVYFAHAWSLAMNDTALINEPVYAWQFGPVIKSVYHEFKSFGSEAITFPGTIVEHNSGQETNNDLGFNVVIPALESQDTVIASLLETVWEVYGEMSAKKLSDLTHMAGTAWGVTASEHKGGKLSDFVLDNHLIQSTMKQELGMNASAANLAEA